MADNEEKTMPEQNGTPSPVRRTIRLKPIQPKVQHEVSLPGVTDDKNAAAPAAQAPTPTTPKSPSAQTIKLTPSPVVPQAAPQAAPDATVVLSPSSVAPQQQESAPSSVIPGAKQTIKLRPSAASVPPATPAVGAPESKPASAQTIKLGGASAPANSASQTIKLGSSAPNTAAKTIKLGGAPTTESSATVKLESPIAPTPSSPTINLDAQTPTGAKRLQIRKSTSNEPALPPSVKDAPASFAEAQKLKKAKKSGKDEPGIVFLITSVAALLVISFIGLMFFAQYMNMNQQEDYNIGLPRYSGSKAVQYQPK